MGTRAVDPRCGSQGIDAVKAWAIAGWRQPDALAVHGPLYAAVESAADALQAQYARSERAREELQTEVEFLNGAWRNAIEVCRQVADRSGFDTTQEPPEGIYTALIEFNEAADKCQCGAFRPLSAPSTPGEEKAG